MLCTCILETRADTNAVFTPNRNVLHAVCHTRYTINQSTRTTHNRYRAHLFTSMHMHRMLCVRTRDVSTPQNSSVHDAYLAHLLTRMHMLCVRTRDIPTPHNSMSFPPVNQRIHAPHAACPHHATQRLLECLQLFCTASPCDSAAAASVVGAGRRKGSAIGTGTGWFKAVLLQGSLELTHRGITLTGKHGLEVNLRVCVYVRVCVCVCVCVCV